MKTTFTGSGSLFVKERSAVVGWPFISFMPNISDCGNEVDTCTLSEGDVLGFSISVSA